MNDNPSKPVNEIKDYVDGRYLCTPEATWQILGYNITQKQPAVTALAIHLPNQNIPQFRTQGSSTSSLIHYFHRPQTPSFASLLYTEYFEKYHLYSLHSQETLQDDEFEEAPIPGTSCRKIQEHHTRSHNIARIQTVSPTAGKLFYLRCLLTHWAGRSFEDLHTINGRVCSSFHEAAIELGLFSNQDEAFYALEEAAATCATPHQLRFLFSCLILEGYPAWPLWDHFTTSLTFDFIVNIPSTQWGIDWSLQEIALLLEEHSHMLEDFRLPEPELCSPEVTVEIDVFDGWEAELAAYAQQQVKQMDEDQREIYDTLYDVILKYNNAKPWKKPHSQPYFIDGKPGWGKTFVADALASKLRSEGIIVLIVGSSAHAATLYECGRTAHHLFCIPINNVCPSYFMLNYHVNWEYMDRIQLRSNLQ